MTSGMIWSKWALVPPPIVSVVNLMADMALLVPNPAVMEAQAEVDPVDLEAAPADHPFPESDNNPASPDMDLDQTTLEVPQAVVDNANVKLRTPAPLDPMAQLVKPVPMDLMVFPVKMVKTDKVLKTSANHLHQASE